MQTFTNLEPEFFKVIDKRYETKDTFTLEIAPQQEKKLSFLPGQFNMLYVFGIGEVPVSISGDPGRDSTYLHTIKVVGNVTQALDRVEVNELIGVRGPFGNPWPVEMCKGKDLVILSGGIGLAPMRPLLYYILNHRQDFGKVAFLYGARSPEEIVFFDELKQWNQELDDQVYVTVDFAREEWTGNVGVVTQLLAHVLFNLDQAAACICGPEIMLRFSVNELLSKEMAEEAIYIAMERNMKCAVGHCGRCQYVSNFICKDGSILPYSAIRPFFAKKEI